MSSLGGIWAWAAPLATGGLLVAGLGGHTLGAHAERGRRWAGAGLAACVAAALGYALHSAAFWFVLQFSASPGAAIAADAVTLASAGLVAWLATRHGPAPADHIPGGGHAPATPPAGEGPDPWRILMAAIALPLALIVFLNLLTLLGLTPYGNWDNWIIWTLRARFIHRGGEHWQRVFDPALRETLSVVTYPLHLSLSIARVWRLTGDETMATPARFAGLYGLLLPATAFFATWRLRSLPAATLALAAVAGPPLAQFAAAMQYADTPLATTFVGALAMALLARGEAAKRQGNWRIWALAGLLAGAGAWTKNEGKLFLLALSLSLCVEWLLMRWRLGRAIGESPLPESPLPDGRGSVGPSPPSWRPAAAATLAFALGPAVFMGANQLIDLRASAANAVVNADSLGRLWRSAGDMERHRLIWRHLASDVLADGVSGNVVIPVALACMALAMGAALVDRRRGRSRSPNSAEPGERVGPGEPALAGLGPCLALAAVAAGYYAVYLQTPMNLDWHLRTSLPRLCLHLWPSAAMLAFTLWGACFEPKR